MKMAMISRATRLSRFASTRLLPMSQVAHFGSPSDRSKIADWGVPESWTAMDVYTDLGYFDEDTFPPALEGETLIEYCERVPNVWSPNSRATDTVDCRVSASLEFAMDWTGEEHQFNERPLIKMAPKDTDLLLYHQDLQEEEIAWTDLMTEEQKAAFDPTEPERIEAIFAKSIQGTGRAQWFKADTFHGWWKEFTGEDYVPSSIASKAEKERFAKEKTAPEE